MIVRECPEHGPLPAGLIALYFEPGDCCPLFDAREESCGEPLGPPVELFTAQEAAASAARALREEGQRRSEAEWLGKPSALYGWEHAADWLDKKARGDGAE